MSRSHKKHYWFKCAGDTSMKKQFNRVMRRSSKKKYKNIPDGAAYKKLNCSWDIADYIFSCSWREYKKYYWDENLSEKENWACWKKIYGSK